LAEAEESAHYRCDTVAAVVGDFLDAKLFELIDADPSDPFDFFIDRYNDQLIAGFTRNQSNYGLLVFMRDFNDLGKPKKAGERLVGSGE